MSDRTQIIVLDDDPTGSQTVHSCLLLLKWDVATLKEALLDDSPIFFVLTNTRALGADEATQITREVCQNLKLAIAEAGTENFLVVSRSDSTLRGHYPVETDVIAEELGPFDAHFMVPAFFEAGRVTLDSTHYIESGGVRTPVHETEFAKDSVFGYSYSYLPDYVAEKTKGRITAEQVQRLMLSAIRQGTQAQLSELSGNVCVAVDAQQQSDLDQLAQDLLSVAGEGKRFLFRSAASLLTSLAALPQQPIVQVEMAKYARGQKPGAVIVGSHVQKTTQQLAELLKLEDVQGVEVDVARLKADLSQAETLEKEISTDVKEIYENNLTPVVYTSREELTFDTTAERLAFGTAVSQLLMDVVHHLPADIGFLISKGGITSNDTLSVGLGLTKVRLLGQIIPGVSVVRTEADHSQLPELPVVLFPGNVGDADGVAMAYRRLRP
ncbi:MAG: four-carbon acid sugar kinase family protein, partial [Cyanobacteria bacterium J06632_22]